MTNEKPIDLESLQEGANGAIDFKATLTAIRKVNKKAETLQESYHNVGIAAMLYAAQLSETPEAACSLMTELVYNMPIGQRTETFKEWVRAYSPIAFSKKERAAVLLDSKSKMYKPFDIEGAKANPYYSKFGAESKPFKTFSDLIATLRNGINRIDDQVAAGKYVGDSPEADKARIQAAIEAIGGNDYLAKRLEEDKQAKKQAELEALTGVTGIGNLGTEGLDVTQAAVH